MLTPTVKIKKKKIEIENKNLENDSLFFFYKLLLQSLYTRMLVASIIKTDSDNSLFRTLKFFVFVEFRTRYFVFILRGAIVFPLQFFATHFYEP